MCPSKKFTGFHLGTSRYVEKGRSLRFEYLRVGYIPQSTMAHR
ncbi:hypothetical protein Gotri_025829 [Gossypium trilobum]|uniref:Uncharacterized protein n=1 Tax=Gossypium trilobum TaxID=34281 RepID=A0A7J9FQU2_9ROSI|nr:hypothetical protein [Gossypium trilobum]